MREPQAIVRDTLWKMGRYGEFGDIWVARWLQYPEAKDWNPKIPKTPQTILLHLGPPPDFNMFADMPPGNVIDASEIISVDDAGLHVDMRLVDAALRQGSIAPLAADARVFRKNGDHWQLGFEGKTIAHRHLKGMLYIHHLLEIAPELIPALQLRRVAEPDFHPVLLGSAGEILDEPTLRKIHGRLAEIDGEIDEAKSHNDFGKLSDLADEQASLREQLRAAVGIGGRKRKIGDDLERNRKTVSKAITDAIKNISATHKELGKHLRTHISCGDHCSYRLEPGKSWST